MKNQDSETPGKRKLAQSATASLMDAQAALTAQNPTIKKCAWHILINARTYNIAVPDFNAVYQVSSTVFVFFKPEHHPFSIIFARELLTNALAHVFFSFFSS